ncbi:myosin-10 isoform X2 [Spodoptera frugiperda]|uniref:Myosin-10 isoform X2 n=1 Tax=Spodoptera frugiperda TaxID=7108 RepID=A0A9R0EM24_SPOFR|nr:myosin-10 isoform X2 [Spodoptera frugiperda]
MKKRTISKLKSIFGSKKGKRQQEQPLKSSRSPSPEPVGAASPVPGNDDSFRPILRTPPPSRAGPPPSPPVPTHPIAPVAPEPTAPLPLLPCAVCGRTFVPQSLAKHVKICEKMTVKKRKTFDSSRQRREGLIAANGANSGTDLEQYLPKNFGLPENSPFLEKSPPNTAKPTPKPKPQSVRNAITKPMAELQRCPHCSRAFGVRAFERHVEWCADKAKILPAAPAQPPQHVAEAKQRLNARTQYKAPPVRGRRSSQTRDKSSNSRSASVDSSRGVSPPQPREYGDYRQGRTRASESVSSNDCHDDPSPHMPVIRNSRNSQNSSSGDANVKARQARLARDLSSSRKKQDPRLSSIKQSSSELIVKKNQSNTESKTKNVNKNNTESNIKKHQQSKVDTNAKKGQNKPEPNIKKVQHSATDPNIKKNHGNTDLSSKKSQTSSIDLNMPNIQQSNTDPDIKKLTTQAKQKNKLIAKKQQQLKKLEEIVNKYSEKKKAEVEDLKDQSKLTRDKSQIPIPKKTKAKKSKIESSADIDQFISADIREMATDVNDNIKTFSTTRSSPSETSEAHTKSRNERDKKIKMRTKKDKIAKETSMSLDSLEECPKTSSDRNCQSIGINTELLCVPCIIHDNPDQKKINKKNKSRKDKNSSKEPEIDTKPEPVVELLYKNPTISNCLEINYMSDSYIKLDTINSNVDSSLITPSTSGNGIDEMDSISDVTRQDVNLSLQIIEDIQISNTNISGDSISEKIDEEIRELSEERFEVDYEHDMSAEVSCNGSIENKYDEENIKEEIGRHGSGETYTKFIEDPADLEEFMHITDKLLSNDQNEQECLNVANDLDQFHTPKTNSIEAIDQKMSDTTINESVKHEFSDTFEELKNNLRELLEGAGNSVNELNEAIKKSEDTKEESTSLPDINRKICDMEHITIYELKFYERKLKEDNQRDEEDSCFKLPSITESNNPGNKVECDNRKMHKIYKPSRKYKMLGEQTRTNKEYQTFIVKQNANDNSDGSVTSDVPPLKLPRIETKSSNNIGSESLFPSSVKRSTSLLDSLQKKNTLKIDSGKSRHKSDQLEQDLMQSLKDFDKFYESEKNENQSSKEIPSYNGTAKRDTRIKTERKIKKIETSTNGNHTPNGKQSNDSAYSSLNRISPSKLSLCTPKEPNGLTSLEQIPAGSDSSGSHKEDVRSISSDEFLAMERSAELDEPLPPPDLLFKEQDNHIDKRVSSRASSRQSPTWRPRASLSSSGSEASLARRRDPAPAQCRRPSRFCHECGNKFPVDTAKFCIECGVKRLVV